MASSDGVRAVVDLENRKPPVLFSTFPGTDVHIWPYLRWPLIQAMAAIELGSEPVLSPITAGQRALKLIKRVLPNPSSASHAPRGRRLLFVVAGRTQADTPHGRKNWLVDDFASLYLNDAIVVQYRELNASGPKGARTFAHTYSFHDAEVKGDIGARLRPLPEAKRRVTEDIVKRAFAELDFPVDEASITIATAKVLRHQGRIHRMRAQYESLLDRVAPSIVVMDGACYGGSRAIQVRAAKERGIHVAELQHGWIGPSHGAYNFGDAVWRDELRQYLPDSLLTFGDYWSRGVTGPFDTVAVGKPHLEQLSAQAPPIRSRERTVLIPSSVNDRDQMTRGVLSLRDALPHDWRVLFRPHPSERATVAQLYPEFIDAERVEIDMTLDVYESLSQVRGVLGFSSTVLYEALSFGCHTFVWDSVRGKYYADRETLGAPLADAEDLSRAVSVLTSDDPPSSSEKSRELWAPDSLQRFREFVETSIAGTRR